MSDLSNAFLIWCCCLNINTDLNSVEKNESKVKKKKKKNAEDPGVSFQAFKGWGSFWETQGQIVRSGGSQNGYVLNDIHSAPGYSEDGWGLRGKLNGEGGSLIALSQQF